MFHRLDKFDGPIFGGGGRIYGGGLHLGVNWVRYMRDVYLGVGLIYGGRGYINEIFRYINKNSIKNFLYETQIFQNVSVLHVNIRGLKTNF